MQKFTERDAVIIEAILGELKKARAKFPSAVFSTVALMEEVGELAQAKLKVRAGKWPQSRVYDEAVQVAVMAIRCAVEHDESFTTVYSEPDETTIKET